MRVVSDENIKSWKEIYKQKINPIYSYIVIVDLPAGTGRWNNVEIELKLGRLFKLNFDVVPTSSARWVSTHMLIL